MIPVLRLCIECTGYAITFTPIRKPRYYYDIFSKINLLLSSAIAQLVRGMRSLCGCLSLSPLFFFFFFSLKKKLNCEKNGVALLSWILQIFYHGRMC